MNVAIWMLSGALVGWLGYSVLGFNQARGKMVSIVIGAIGGFVGGNLVAPMFITSSPPSEFSFPALVFAAAFAAAFLAIGNLMYTRWGV
jgi:uncharacterized membrane protein YeaQ/YmgE (transglycosylase-associated protein family)